MNTSEHNLTKRRLLVVDDNPANCTVLRIILGKLGFASDMIHSGEAALVHLGTTQDYDAILMDLYMPHMDGYETTRCIRAMGGDLETLPILAITADISPDIEARVKAAGFQGYMPKPLSVKVLSDVLDEVLVPNRKKIRVLRDS